MGLCNVGQGLDGCWVVVDWREEALGLGLKLNVGGFSGMMSWEGARGGLGVRD